MPENLYTRLFYDLFWDKRFRTVYRSCFSRLKIARNSSNALNIKAVFSDAASFAADSFKRASIASDSEKAKSIGTSGKADSVNDAAGAQSVPSHRGSRGGSSGDDSGGTKTDAEIASAFDAFGNSILRLAYSYLHNMEDAEDILQETLIRFMNKAPAFDSDEHEKAWLLRVAANLAKNKIDYNNIRKTDQLKDELVAEEKNDLSFVWEAVKNLPEAERAVIHLFYQEGYATAQIAGILNEKEATVRSHLRRGRAKLKEILKEEYDFG